MRFEAMVNAVLYTALGLGIFAGAVKVWRSDATEMPQALVRAAAILGAAWIIAATLH